MQKKKWRRQRQNQTNRVNIKTLNIFKKRIKRKGKQNIIKVDKKYIYIYIYIQEIKHEFIT